MSKLNLTILLNAVDKITAPFKSAEKASQKLATALKESKDSLKSLEKVQGQINGFQRLKANIDNSTKSIQKYSEKIASLQGKHEKLKSGRDNLIVNIKDKKRELQQLINAQNALRSAGKSNSNEFSVLNAQVMKANHTIFRMEEQLQKQKNALGASKQAINAEKSALKASRHEKALQLVELRRLQQKLKESGVNVKRLGTEELITKNKISQATKEIDKQKKALERLNKTKAAQQKYQQRVEALKNTSDKTKEFGQHSIVMGGAVLGTGAAMMKPAVEFEQAFSKVQALTRLDKNNAVDAAKIKALRDQAINLGATTSFTSTDVAAGQSYLAMAGFNQEQITQSMPAILNMTKAADMDMGRVSDISSDILSGFGKKAEEMNHIADVLTLTFTSSNVNLEMLGESMKYVGPLAAKTGQSFESMAAMVGLLGNVGIKGSQSGTALRAMLNRLSGPTKAATKQLNKLSVKTKDAKGNLRALPDILADIAKKTKKMGSADQLAILKDIFGEEAATAAAELIKQAGEKNIREFDKKLKEANGTAQKVAETMSDNLMGDLKGLDSAREALGITIFDGQSNALRELTQTATSWLRTVNEWIKANPELTSKIIRWMAILASAATVIGALSIASSFILYPLARMGLGFLKVGGIVLSLGGKFLGLIRAISLLAMANPIILAIAAVVVALAGVAYLIYKNWEPLSKWFKEIWDQVKVKFDEVKKWFSDLSSDFLKFGEDMIASLKKGIEDKFKAVTNFIKEKVDWIKEKLGFSTEAETKINEIQRKAKQEELQKGVRQFHGGANILMDTAGRDVLKQQVALSDLPGRATGGYTGNGGKYDPAGIVHRGEFVFSKAATSRLGVGFLSSLHSAKTAKAGMIAAGLASSVAMAQPISVEARPTIATVQPTQQTAQAVPMTVSININTQGGDANAIAKAVRQELEKVQQQQQARARSRLVGRG
ncbi:phage-related minor tail protein [Gallibacterium anatis UMN179]|uniref:Phage-related minor tail protein n=1 Tax=Gallibacterium anatis (strain UMN179) TaxID=1005058 RepID=F4HB27_GALAU|nr:phage tail tape measure protein [Gallibacterium anatis]AEC16259.1 phage-related minor tail protein [Gallibacterium anatis UMN179]